ncbi:hypothetical protein PRZ48_014517 [Zasmidium cellare]|uniref:Transcription factor domain-containing protein n=1 Tax=Zasmidium cellare TaxID=395010 RepID=A0ABR0DYP7_ZASCE|nr:hypothetical protein PRZ48_014517 [Zasmidium cellare]
MHIPTFLDQVKANRPTASRNFVCLQLALLSVVLAVVPDTFDRYKSVDTIFRSRFLSKVEAVEAAQTTFDIVKGPDFFDQASLPAWATAYLFGVAYSYLQMPGRSSIYGCQAYSLALSMRVHVPRCYEGLDHITSQMRKRVLWMTLTGIMRVFERGLDSWTNDLAQNIESEELVPLNVDDEYITEEQVENQPARTLSIMAGFIAEKRILACLASIWHQSVLRKAHSLASSAEESYSVAKCECGREIMVKAEITVLTDCLRRLRYLLDDIPGPLSAFRRTSPADESEFDNDDSNKFIIQKTNLHVTLYWAQNYVIECLLQHTADRSSDTNLPDEVNLWELRDNLCRDLLLMLAEIPLSNIQKNGFILVYKIRQIAAALLDCPATNLQLAPILRRARAHVADFASILAQIEGHEFSD